MSDTNELLFQLALTRVPNIGYVHTRALVQHFGYASSVFKASRSILEKIEGIGSVRAGSIKSFDGFAAAEAEMKFLDQYRIRPLFLTDAAYPQRLLHCVDAPALLFYKGSADLNASRILAIVGTRNHTDYGKQVTETLVKELSELNLVIISGLAFGIDAAAHKCSLKHDIPTVGVVGHGLDQIYPAAHAGLAKEMVRNGGGLLTEFWSKTAPDKHNFPGRNRIVAGISDAVVLVETGIKGGSMITAEIANSYNRDVFAVPGKIIDPKSAGCNQLIKSNKAMLLTSAAELLEAMGWHDKQQSQMNRQKALFIQLNPDEQKIVSLLQGGGLHIDEINLRCELSTSAMAAAILNLEMQGVVRGLPGKIYQLS